MVIGQLLIYKWDNDIPGENLWETQKFAAHFAVERQWG
jgi:hypothetical protein